MKRTITLVMLLCIGAVPVWADSLQVQGGDAVGFYDTKWYELSHTNYGTATTLSFVVTAGGDRNGAIYFDNLDTIGAGQVCDSVKFHLYMNVINGNDSLLMWEMFKPMQETLADWYCWEHVDGVNDSNWTTEGCDNGSDAGTWNRSDGTGADRFASAEDTVAILTGGVNTYHTLTWRGAEVDSVYQGTRTHYGFLIKQLRGTQNTAYSSENASNTPIVTIFYHASTPGGATGPPDVVHGVEGAGLRHGSSGESVVHGVDD